MSSVVNELRYHDWTLSKIFIPRQGFKPLNPWNPWIFPYIDCSSITNEMACTFHNKLFCILYSSPSRRSNLCGSFRSQSCLTLYLALRISIHKLSLLDATSQANFTSKTLFTSFVCLKPRSPSYLGKHSLSQAFQAMNLPSFSLGVHQNFLIKESILSQFFAGIDNGHSIIRYCLSN